MTARWIGTHAAALICHVTPRTMRRWCEDGLIPPAHYQTTLGGHYRIEIGHVYHLRDLRMREDVLVEVSATVANSPVA